jgi:hypothetical protein
MTTSENSSTVLNSVDIIDNISTQQSIERHSQAGFNPEQLIPKPTYLEVGIEKITALCNAVGLNDKTDRIIEVFQVMASSWGERKIGTKSAWQSDVSDDGSPFEFSIALDPKQAELRILVEAQGQDPTLQSN